MWILYGDGACGWSLSELDTFVRHGIAVIAIIGNDACWSQIHRAQVELFKDDVGCMLRYTKYHLVAQGFDCIGIQVQNEKEIPDALKKAKDLAKKGKPVIVNCLIGKTDFLKGSLSM